MCWGTLGPVALSTEMVTVRGIACATIPTQHQHMAWHPQSYHSVHIITGDHVTQHRPTHTHTHTQTYTPTYTHRHTHTDTHTPSHAHTPTFPQETYGYRSCKAGPESWPFAAIGAAPTNTDTHAHTRDGHTHICHIHIHHTNTLRLFYP